MQYYFECLGRKHCVFVLILLVALSGCTSLEKGKCKHESHCDKMGKGFWVCYKEPEDAEIGTCMTVKEARIALAAYQRKQSSTCVDNDGDGVKAGDACDEPIDCNDNDPTIFPGAKEICDSKDNNCNKLINEGVAHCVGTVLGGNQDPIVNFRLPRTSGVTVAPNGDIFVSVHHQIYRIDKQGKVHLLAGSNEPGNKDGVGENARFYEPRGIAVSEDGTVYVAECRNNCIRKITKDGVVSTYAGLCSAEADYTGLDKDGTADKARFWCPIDISMDNDGNLLVVDMRNSKIKSISKDREVSTIAGRGGKQDAEGFIVFGNANGPALQAEFNEPAGIAVGSDNTIYIADYKNNCIRKIAHNQVSNFAGVCKSGLDKGGHKDGRANKALFNLPNSVSVDTSGNVWVADTGNHCIRKIEQGMVSTVTGKPGSLGYYDGPIEDALFNQPQTISIAQDKTIYVIDLGNYRVRSIIP